jgi:hypothetical protein
MHGAVAPLPALRIVPCESEGPLAAVFRFSERRQPHCQHTACAAISFKHHKELFSETLPRNLP